MFLLGFLELSKRQKNFEWLLRVHGRSLPFLPPTFLQV